MHKWCFIKKITFQVIAFDFFLAKDCGLLRAPVNGSTVGNLSTFPNKVFFQCDEGFILKGSETRQCQANGLWTGNETTCKGKSGTRAALVQLNSTCIAQNRYDYVH